MTNKCVNFVFGVIQFVLFLGLFVGIGHTETFWGLLSTSDMETQKVQVLWSLINSVIILTQGVLLYLLNQMKSGIEQRALIKAIYCAQ